MYKNTEQHIEIKERSQFKNLKNPENSNRNKRIQYSKIHKVRNKKTHGKHMEITEMACLCFDIFWTCFKDISVFWIAHPEKKTRFGPGLLDCPSQKKTSEN